MNHAIKAIAHEIKIRRVAYFYSAAERRSRGALWPSFAPALIHFAFAFQPVNRRFSFTLNLFMLSTHASFCVLQSRPHEIWTRFFGSTLEDRLRYTPSDCFETFPFPEDWESRPELTTAGNAYYEFRAGLMIRNNEGLTRTYNRFHDPNDHDPQIAKLRDHHAAMDRAVLDAYTWKDIPTACEFLLDYEIDEEESNNKKKPWRYRWPDKVRDDVLARLLELNARRAKEEELSGAAAAKKVGKTPPKRATKKSDMEDLFS